MTTWALSVGRCLRDALPVGTGDGDAVLEGVLVEGCEGLPIGRLAVVVGIGGNPGLGEDNQVCAFAAGFLDGGDCLVDALFAGESWGSLDGGGEIGHVLPRIERPEAVAAGHGDDRAGDVAGRVGKEEGDGAGDFVVCAETPHRGVGLDAFAVPARHRLGQWGVDEGGATQLTRNGALSEWDHSAASVLVIASTAARVIE